MRPHFRDLSLKILLVEDVEDSMEIMERAFEDDFIVLKASDGKQAVKIALRERPDIILMDMNLPMMSGLETTRRIKACPSLRGVPVVAISASAMEGNKKDALDAGCADFIAKPIRPSELKKKIEEIIRRLYEQNRNNSDCG